ncbi:MAG: hypothetical protein IT280_13120 [Ignavibacteria bacterium]|nr:hypothetical protein [Ignavibacteria bacterium]
MAWNKQVTADNVILRCMEDKGLYQLTNRSYDSLVQPGATEVVRPKLASMVVKKNTGTAADDADRKKTKDDTSMVTTALDVYAVPILAQMAAKFESNDMLRTQYEISMALALKRQFNKDVIEAAQATTNIIPAAAAQISFRDFSRILKHFDDNEVPEENRVIVIPSALEQDFYEIDVIKTAIGFNMKALRAGEANEMLGAKWVISGLVPTIGGKTNIVAWHQEGLAFILSNEGEIKEAYQPTVLGDAVDLLAHGAAELDGNEFACVIKSL